MKEQFDKELRDHIKDSFDVYDDQMADDGWKKFQKKVNRNKRKVILMWSFPSGIAAAIAFIFLFNSPLFDSVETENHLVFKPETSIQENQKVKQRNSINQSQVNSIDQKTEIIYSSEKQTPVGKSSKQLEKLEQVVDPAYQPEEKILLVVNKLDTFQRIDTAPIEENIALAQVNSNIRENTIEDKTLEIEKDFSKNTFLDKIPTHELNPVLANQVENDKNPSKKSNKLNVGLDASTYMNFTDDGLNNDMNLGIGVTSAYKISKNISINSGININRQSTIFNANNSARFAQASNIALKEMEFSKDNAVASTVNDQVSNAKLIGFDIPISIKYQSTHNNNKMNWFLSTGLSAYTVLNERYLNTMSVVNYSLMGAETTSVTTQEENSEDPFSNLQLARTLNFSFGIIIPVNKNTALSVEPFVKYPLNGIGQEDLKIGSGGVSFKMNLNKLSFK
jgi:hypothetical protein